MQSEIDGLMMAKKNSAVLWTVDQTGDVIGADGREKAQKNIGLGSTFVKAQETGKFVTHVSRIDDPDTGEVAGELKIHTANPKLSDIAATIGDENKSIVTDNNGKMVAVALSASQTTGNATTSFVSAVTEDTTGNVTVTTSSITTAAVETAGIVPLINDIDKGDGTIVTNKEDHAVTPLGVKSAIDTLNVNDSAVTHKYVSSVSESNGKVSVQRELLTLASINPEKLYKGNTVGINATTGEIEPQDLGTVEILEGSDPTNRFVSSIDQASNGQISYTTQELKLSASDSIGGIKLGYTDSTVGTKNYAVNVDTNGKAYVNVPWTGTVTSITAGTGLTTDPAAGITGTGSISLNAAGDNALGGIKLGYTDSTVGNRNYAVNVDSNGKAYVNVPWTGTVTSIAAGTGLTTDPAAGITGTGSISLNTAGNDALGGIKLGYTESKADRQYPVKLGSSGNNVGKAYVEVPLASVYNATAANMYPGLVTSAAPPADTSMANRYYNVEIADNQGHMKVYVPWVDNIYYVPYGENNYSDALAAFNAHKLVYTIIPTSVTHSSEVTAVAATVAGSMMHFRSTVSTGQLSTTYFAYEKSDGTWMYVTDSVVGIPPGETGYAGRVLTLNDNLHAEWGVVEAGDSLPPHGAGDGRKVLALSDDGATPGWYSNYKRTNDYYQAFSTSQQISRSDDKYTYLYIENAVKRYCIGVSDNGNFRVGEETGKTYSPSEAKTIIYSSPDATSHDDDYHFNGGALYATKATQDASGNTITSFYKSKDATNNFTASQKIVKSNTDGTYFGLENSRRHITIGINNTSDGQWGLWDEAGKTCSPSSTFAVIQALGSGDSTEYRFRGLADNSTLWDGYALSFTLPSNPTSDVIAFL